MTDEQKQAVERLRSDSYSVIHGRMGPRLTTDGGSQLWEDLQIVKEAYLALVTPEREAERRDLCAILSERLKFAAETYKTSHGVEAFQVSVTTEYARRLLAFLEGTT